MRLHADPHNAFALRRRLKGLPPPRTKRLPQAQNMGARLPRPPACRPRDPSLVQRNAGLGTTLVMTATVGVLFAGGAGLAAVTIC
jgi:hypothetical protein